MAGRIRTIKPELLSAPQFASLSDIAARLFFAIYSLADDEGRCPGSWGYLNGQVFWAKPRTQRAVTSALRELDLAGFIELYEVDRTEYLAVIGWRSQIDGQPNLTHQRIEKPRASRIPAPRSNRSGNGRGSVPVPVDASTSDLRPPTVDLGPGDLGPPGPVAEDSLPADQKQSEEAELQEAVCEFEKLYGAHTGDLKPTWRNGHVDRRARLGELVAAHGVVEVTRRMRNMFHAQPTWPREQDLPTFLSHFDRFAIAGPRPRVIPTHGDYAGTRRPTDSLPVNDAVRTADVSNRNPTDQPRDGMQRVSAPGNARAADNSGAEPALGATASAGGAP